MFVNVPLRMGNKKRTGCLCFKSFITYFGSSILPVSFYFFRIFRRMSLLDFCRLSRLCGKKKTPARWRGWLCDSGTFVLMKWRLLHLKNFMPHADQERTLVLQRYVFNSILNLACHNHLSLHSEYGVIRTRSCIAD